MTDPTIEETIKARIWLCAKFGYYRAAGDYEVALAACHRLQAYTGGDTAEALTLAMDAALAIKAADDALADAIEGRRA